jgi:hypothetical protein
MKPASSMDEIPAESDKNLAVAAQPDGAAHRGPSDPSIALESFEVDWKFGSFQFFPFRFKFSLIPLNNAFKILAAGVPLPYGSTRHIQAWAAV